MKIIVEEKLAYFDNLSQSIVFNYQGEILQSCDTLMATHGQNVFDQEFFVGLEESLKAISLNQKLSFEGVHTDVFGKTSYFDFLVTKIIYGTTHAFVWMIYDFGRQYKRAFDLARQKRNSLDAKPGNGIAGNKMLIKTTDKLVILCLDDVLYFEAYGDYVKIHTPDKLYVHYNRMKNIEARVPENQFLRIHRSFIVSLDKIDHVDKESVQINNRWIPVSATNKTNLLDRLKQI